MAGPRVAIKVDLDSKAAEQGFKRLQDIGKASFTEINQAMELAGKAFRFVTGAMSSAIDVASKWAKAAAESEKAQARLALVAGDQLEALKKLNAEMLRKHGIDDDDSAALQTKLAALGVLPRDLERATKATIGLADATGKDLTRASREVAKAFQKGGDEAQRLERLFAITEGTSHTFAATTKRLEANWGELEETLGGAITQSEGLKGAMDAVSETLAAFVQIFEGPDGRRAVDEFFRSIIGLAAQSINAFLGLRRAALDLHGSLRAGNEGVIVEGAAGTEAIDIKPQDPASIQALQALADRLTGIGAASGSVGAGVASQPSRVSVGKAVGARKGKKQQDARGFDAHVTELLKHEIEVQEHLADRKKDADAALLEQTIKANDARFEAELAAFQERQALKDEELRREQEFAKTLTGIGVNAFADMISGFTQALIEGSSIGKLMQDLLGGVLIQMGQAMIAEGTALAIIALFSQGAGGAQAAGLLAGGAVLVGAGAALRSGARSGGGARSPARAGATGGGRVSGGFDSAEPRGFVDSKSGSPAPVVHNYYFNGPMGGSARRIARDLEELMSDGRTLRPT